MTKKAALTALFWAIIIAVLYLGASVLIPLAFAGLLATLFDGFSSWLEQKGFPRSLSSLLSVLAFVGFVSAIGFVLAWQLSGFIEQSEDMKGQAMDQIEKLRDWVSETFGIGRDEQKEMMASQQSGQTGNALAAFVAGLTQVTVNTVLVLVYLFLLLYYRSHLKKFLLAIIPEERRGRTEKIIVKSADVSSHYLRGLFMMVAALWVMYGIGFSIVGIEGAIFFALLCGSLEIIPFIGNFIGNLVVVLSVLVQGGDGGMVLGVVAVYFTIQFFQTYVLETLVVGRRVDINPLFTILGLVVGELIWGVAGVALAIPTLGIIKIICDHVPEWKAYGALIGPEKPKKKSSFMAKLFSKLIDRSR